MSDPVRAYTSVCSDPKLTVCNCCKKQLPSNVTYLKRHIASSVCTAPHDVKRKIEDRLLAGQHKASVDTNRMQRLKRKLDEAAGDGEPAGGKQLATGVATDQSTVDSYVTRMSEQERDTADELFSRWVYREALPFRLAESANLQTFLTNLNPAYKLPSKNSMANRLLKNAFVAQQCTGLCASWSGLSRRAGSRVCHGYIPEDYVHALYPYPLRIRAGDAYSKCIMRKRREVISILSDKNCKIISNPYPR